MKIMMYFNLKEMFIVELQKVVGMMDQKVVLGHLIISLEMKNNYFFHGEQVKVDIFVSKYKLLRLI